MPDSRGSFGAACGAHLRGRGRALACAGITSGCLLLGCASPGPERRATVDSRAPNKAEETAARSEPLPRYVLRAESRVHPYVVPAFLDTTAERKIAVGTLVYLGTAVVVLAVVLLAGSSTEVGHGELFTCREATVEGTRVEVCFDSTSDQQLEPAGPLVNAVKYKVPATGEIRPIPGGEAVVGSDAYFAACADEPDPGACRLVLTTVALDYSVHLNREWHELGDYGEELFPSIPGLDPNDPARLDRRTATVDHADAVKALSNDLNEPGPNCEAVHALRKSYPYVPALPCGDVGEYCATLLVCQQRTFPDIVVSASEVQVPITANLHRVAEKHGLNTVAQHFAKVRADSAEIIRYLRAASLWVRLIEVGFNARQATSPGEYFIQYAPVATAGYQASTGGPHTWEWWVLGQSAWDDAGEVFLGPEVKTLMTTPSGQSDKLFGPNRAPYQVPRHLRAVLGVRRNLEDGFPRRGLLLDVHDQVVLYPASDKPPPLPDYAVPDHIKYAEGHFASGFWH